MLKPAKYEDWHMVYFLVILRNIRFNLYLVVVVVVQNESNLNGIAFVRMRMCEKMVGVIWGARREKVVLVSLSRWQGTEFHPW
jgi:hypothetical protein